MHAAGFDQVNGVPVGPCTLRTALLLPRLLPHTTSSPWALALVANTFFLLHRHRHAGLTFLRCNVGGVEALVEYVCNVLIALDSDFFALQELW